MARRITLAALTTGMVLTLAGCGSEEPSSDPDEGATASSSASTGTGVEEPEVPSDWQVASVDVAQLQVPPDWVLSSTRDASQTMAAPKDSIGLSPGSGNILADPNPGGGEGEDAVDEWADLREKSLSADLKNLERLPNETINGSVFYHFQGEGDGTWEDHYGAVVPGGDRRITITWRFNQADIDRKGAEALIAEVMPTYQVL